MNNLTKPYCFKNDISGLNLKNEESFENQNIENSNYNELSENLQKCNEGNIINVFNSNNPNISLQKQSTNINNSIYEDSAKENDYLNFREFINENIAKAKNTIIGYIIYLMHTTGKMFSEKELNDLIIDFLKAGKCYKSDGSFIKVINQNINMDRENLKIF